jgi:hypothetical protein
MSCIFYIMSNSYVTKEAKEETVGMSFEERSVWIQLISMLLVLSGYFYIAWQMLSQGVLEVIAYAAVFIVAGVFTGLIIAAGHIAVAIASRHHGRDERDRLIEWRAESYSGWVLAAGVLVSVTGMALSWPNAWTANLLLFSLFLAEVLKFTLQLVLHRRGL